MNWDNKTMQIVSVFIVIFLIGIEWIGYTNSLDEKRNEAYKDCHAIDDTLVMVCNDN